MPIRREGLAGALWIFHYLTRLVVRAVAVPFF